MAGTLLKLANWVADLDVAGVPPDVLQRVRLQHLSTAGAIRAACSRSLGQWVTRAAATGGRTPVLGSSRKTLSRRDAVRYHAALASQLVYDDALFSAHPSAGVVTTWAYAGKASLDQVLVATLAANEVAARFGAAGLLGPSWGRTAGWIPAVATTIAAAKLSNLDANTIAHALALAIQAPQTIPWKVLLGGPSRSLSMASPAVVGIDAVALAAAGGRGSLDALDDRQGFFSCVTPLPLRSAFTGLGTAWLTRTLAYTLMPGAEHIQVPVQAVQEILARHVKAAERRLRPDQWDRVEVAVDGMAFALDQVAAGQPGIRPGPLPYAIARSIGALGVHYGLGPEQLDPDWLGSHSATIADLAQRVEILHDWRATEAWVEHLLDVAEPLFSGVKPSELRAAARRLLARNGAQLGTPNPHELFAVLKRRPDRVLSRLSRGSGDLKDMDVAAFRYKHAVEVKLYTTRGGWWPERRELAEGSPGWSWDKTVAGVLAKAAQGDADRRTTAEALLVSDGVESGSDWVGSLLG
jgi:2-methylcitrate dehydratase PrpD